MILSCLGVSAGARAHFHHAENTAVCHHVLHVADAELSIQKRKNLFGHVVTEADGDSVPDLLVLLSGTP